MHHNTSSTIEEREYSGNEEVQSMETRKERKEEDGRRGKEEDGRKEEEEGRRGK